MEEVSCKFPLPRPEAKQRATKIQYNGKRTDIESNRLEATPAPMRWKPSRISAGACSRKTPITSSFSQWACWHRHPVFMSAWKFWDFLCSKSSLAQHSCRILGCIIGGWWCIYWASLTCSTVAVFCSSVNLQSCSIDVVNAYCRCSASDLSWDAELCKGDWMACDPAGVEHRRCFPEKLLPSGLRPQRVWAQPSSEQDREKMEP